MEPVKREKLKKGFALLSPERRREVASLGGKTAHQEGRAYTFTSEKAREAGRKGVRSRMERAGKSVNFARPTESYVFDPALTFGTKKGSGK